MEYSYLRNKFQVELIIIYSFFQEQKGCGRLPSRIIGGSEVTPYSIPWQVGLDGLSDFAPIDCGGTIITERHILTAAHCFCQMQTGDCSIFKPSDIDVIVGEHDQTDNADGTRHHICSYDIHPLYKFKEVDDNPYGIMNTNEYDLAVLHLTEPIKLGNRAIPACLPDSRFFGDIFTGKTLTVSGWGDLDLDFTKPDKLHAVNVTGVSQDKCKELYQEDARLRVYESMMCAGDVNGGKDSCQGDSGGN